MVISYLYALSSSAVLGQVRFELWCRTDSDHRSNSRINKMQIFVYFAIFHSLSLTMALNKKDFRQKLNTAALMMTAPKFIQSNYIF